MKTAIIILILFISNLSFAQTTKISGTISDSETGETLPNTTVFLRSKTSVGTSSNLVGVYELELVGLSGKIELVFSFIGYKEQVREVELIGNQVVLNVKLESAISKMEEITIQSERLIAEEFTVTEIKKMDIYINPIAKADPLLAVNGLPASTTTDESANISLRGSSPSETGIFLNNVPIYDAVRFAQLNGIGTFSIFNTAIIKSLQVFPSNPPLEFGNTTSGLIALQTDDNVPKKSIHSISANLAGVGGMTLNPIGKKGSVAIFGNFQPSFALKAFNETALESLGEFRSGDFGVHLFHQIGKKSTLKVFNYSLLEGYQFNFKHPSGNFPFEQSRKRNFTVANFRTVFDNKSELSINHGNSFSKMDLGGGNLQIKDAKRDLFLSVNYQRFFKQFQFKTGFSWDRRVSESKNTFPTFDYALAEQFPSESFNYKTEIDVPESYFYAKYTFTEKWAIGVGLRKNLFGTGDENYLSYQANMNYAINEKSRFNFSVGNYHKYNPADANSNQLYLIDSEQVALDYAYDDGKLKITSAVFYKKAKLGEIENEIYGIESFVSYQLGQKLQASVSLTSLTAEVSEGDLRYPSNYDLDYFARATLQYKPAKKWIIGASWLFRQGVHYQPLSATQFDSNLGVFQPFYRPITQQERLPNYSILDVNISRVFLLSENSNLITFASVSNAFNRENVRSVNYNSDYTESFNELFSQRTFFFGVILNFI
jgi:hypothetical protein